MPKIKSNAVEDRDSTGRGASAGGVVLVERTVRLLGCFTGKEASLSLTELSARAGLHKSTVLRVARALAQAGYLVQLADKTWRLGPAAGGLGAAYQQSFDLNNVVMPLLKTLAAKTGMTASFFVRESDTRSCVHRVEATDDSRPSVRPGTAFPLARGAPGRVILAFSGEAGAEYEAIRRKGFCLGMRERSTDDASVSAPVFGANWQIVGAISLSGTASLQTRSDLERLAAIVVEAAAQASRALGGRYLRKATR